MKLPEPAGQMSFDLQSGLQPCFTAYQMHEMYKQGLEDAAKVCEEESWRLKSIAVSNQSAATNSKSICASNLSDAIRALKEQE